VPEVHRLCHILGIDEPPWFEDDAVRERVASTRSGPMIFKRDGTEVLQHRSQDDLSAKVVAARLTQTDQSAGLAHPRYSLQAKEAVRQDAQCELWNIRASLQRRRREPGDPRAMHPLLNAIFSMLCARR